MDNINKKTAKNAAKIEFLACSEEVMSMLDRGYNKLNIYNKLNEKQLITMSYRSFCWNLQKFQNIKPEQKKKTVQAIATRPLMVCTKKSSFGQIEDIDVASLI